MFPIKSTRYANRHYPVGGRRTAIDFLSTATMIDLNEHSREQMKQKAKERNKKIIGHSHLVASENSHSLMQVHHTTHSPP